MSDEPEFQPETPRRGARRVALLVVFWVLVAVLALAGGLAWYATTPAFGSRLRHAVVARLQQATGGRVELKGFTWHLAHLEFAADDLTIHGREAPGEVPYFHVDRLYVRLRLLSFLRPKISLSYLEADHPVVHLIVYPDGSTNQPRPRRPSTLLQKNEIFSLAIARGVVDNGVVIINERKIPFSLAANHLAARLAYVPSDGHYVGQIHAEDIVLHRGKNPPVDSALDAELDVSRSAARLISLTLKSGVRGHRYKAVLRVSGALNDFADPHWKFAAQGAVDAREIRALTGVAGLRSGIGQMNLSGSGARRQYSIGGTVNLAGGAYRYGTVEIQGLSAHAETTITPDRIAVTGIHARLASGGAMQGDLHLVNWRHTGHPAAAAPVQGTVTAHLSGLPLDSLLRTVAPRRFHNLGFDGAASGTAQFHWVGRISSLEGSTRLTIVPSHAPKPGEVPAYGTIDAGYSQASGLLSFRTFDLRTPDSRIQITGSLDSRPTRRNPELHVSFITHNLSEFNPVLASIGISAPGQASPIPAVVHGEAEFHGVVSGSLVLPQIQGQLRVTNFNLAPTFVRASLQKTLDRVHFDSLTAGIAYKAGSFSVEDATLIQGKSTIRFSGVIHGHPGQPRTLFDKTSAVTARVQVEHARLSEWAGLTGGKYPVSGTLSLQGSLSGTLGDPEGSGHLSVTGGSVYGQPYRSLATAFRFRGKDFTATRLMFAVDSGLITGNGGFNFANRTVRFDVQGNDLNLSHVRLVQMPRFPVSGVAAFTARGSGPLRWPNFQGSFHVRNLRVARTMTGTLDAQAHTDHGELQTYLAAHLNAAVLDVTSRTRLGGEFDTRAEVKLTHLNIDPFLRTYSVTGIRGSSDIAAAIAVAGPLRHPRRLSGDAVASELSVTLEGIPLHSDGALHATLQDGTLRLDRVRIVGPDTDMHIQGTLGLFSTPRPIRLSAGGAVNMGLAETLDTDLVSSGHVNFTVTAHGTTRAPNLVGEVKLADVSLALDDYTNGLSRMNGTLEFDQDRLDFKDVTAYSGGGLIRVGGFATYRHGLYVDLTAKAHQVRIRYPQGVTSTANASLRFQGTQASMMLSGHVIITGFSVSPNLDFAALTSSTSSVALPPSPNSPANRVRLDIRISSAPSLNFQNSFARLAGNVNLSIRGTLAQPTVLGRVTISEGTATFNGDRFEVQHGEIYFSNPVRIQPMIDVTATTQVEDYTITIDLQGTTSNLTPTFRSEPPLSEQDIFSLLAMGRTQEEQQIYQNEAQQAGVNSTANALLGSALNATISNRIQKLFGGGSVRIDPTFVTGIGNATARITVTEPVSKQATLTYATNVNSTAEQLIQGEWHLTKDFSIVAVRDESGVFSLIFRLHRRYK